MEATTVLALSIFLTIMGSYTFALKKSYVVYLGAHSHAAETSFCDFDTVTEFHYEFLGSFLGSKQKAKDSIFYSYTRHINGFAAVLEDAEAAELSNHAQVISVFLNKGRNLLTTRSWGFMGLEDYEGIHSSSIWKKARFGQDSIIGNIDSGVWPESKSFSDDEMGPILSKWKGICQNDNDASFHCNRKLIGARYFNKGYAIAVGARNSSFEIETPRDNSGHGTHTLSIAGGNFVTAANVFGLGNGTAKGGSPNARVAAYKVCWLGAADNQCYDADILAGFDMAIHDGVDVLSVSLQGYYDDYFRDSVAIGSFHAFLNGIVVVCSAGNAGPHTGTVANLAPWQITVAASTMDRRFPNYVVLGNNLNFRGESLSPEALPNDKLFPIITAESAKAVNILSTDAMLCKVGTLDPKKVKGKIVVCLRGDIERTDKSHEAAATGAIGMVLVNDKDSGNEVDADPHVLPASHINYTDGLALFSYISNTRFPRAYITRPTTQLSTKPAPFIAAFSSKGPNIITPEILKPDITAPGVSVIAAFTEAKVVFGRHKLPFNSLSGTSMSCPHVSGVVGLLKNLHPDWSPNAIKSAIMTTARTRDNFVKPMRNAFHGKATPFDYGAGHLNPNKAMDPGLVYDLTRSDYLNFICSLGYNETQTRLLFSKNLHNYKCPEAIDNLMINFNYPSITIPYLRNSTTVTRTLKNVGSPAKYIVYVVKPSGVSVEVGPKTLEFRRYGEEKMFQLTLKLRRPDAARHYVFGRLTWSDGKHHVRSPIVVKSAPE